MSSAQRARRPGPRERAPRESAPAQPQAAEPAETPAPAPPAARELPLLRLAAGAVAAEALGLCVAIVFNLVDVAGGRGSTASDALGFILLEAVIAAGVGAVAAGLARVRPWSRTPALLTQLFTLLIAVWLLQAHDYGWGVPALLLALAGFAGLAGSVRMLNRRL